MDHQFPEKVIKKKRRAVMACDACRSKKKKCDGETPCFRCKSLAKICTYSKKERKPNATPVDKKISIPVDRRISVPQEGLSAIATTNMYFQLFFRCLNLISFFHKFDMSMLERPNTKPALLQYNTILAISTRAFSSNPEAYLTFENRARQLAGDLFDDCSFDTAVGFELLGLHFWWDSEERFGFYRELTLSILNRVYKSGEHDPYWTSRLMIAATGLTPLLDSSVTDDVEKVTDLFKKATLNHNPGETFTNAIPSAEGEPISDAEVMLWTTLRIRLAEYVFKEVQKLTSNGGDGNSQNYLPLESLREIILLIEQMHKLFSRKEAVKVKSEIIMRMMAASAYYAGGYKSHAINQIRTLLDKFDTSNVPFNTIGPFFSDLLHTGFRIAFNEKEYQLANVINGYQRKMAEIVPSARKNFHTNMELLKTIPTSSTNQSQLNSIFELPPIYPEIVHSNPPPLNIDDGIQYSMFPQLPVEEESFINQLFDFSSDTTPSISPFLLSVLGDNNNFI